MDKKKTSKILKRALIITAVLAGLLGLGYFVWQRAVEVRELKRIDIPALADDDEAAPITADVLEDDKKTVLIFFTIRREEGFAYVDNLMLANIGQWGLQIPVEAYMSQNGDYIQVQKLFAAGERLMDETSGVVYLMDKTEALTGVGIDGYVAVNQDTPGGIDWGVCFGDLSVVSYWLRPSRARDFLGSTRSNLEQEALVDVAGIMTESEVEYSSLSLEDAEKVQVQDGEIRVFDSEYIDGVVREFPKTTDLLLEQAKLEVYNGTGVSGLAGRYSRFFGNSGLAITRVEDAPEYYENTVIFVPDGETVYPKSLEVIMHDLGEQVEVREERPRFLTTGDIIVILGQDAVRWTATSH